VIRCPACAQPLVPTTLDGLTVDVCSNGCGGIWFDHGELRRFADPAYAAGRALVAVAPRLPTTVDPTPRRRCPKCPDSVLMRHYFSPQRAVTIDGCPTCAGIWLDAGELDRIRTEYPSDAARHQAARAPFEAVLVDDRMALINKESEDQLPCGTHRYPACCRRFS